MATGTIDGARPATAEASLASIQDSVARLGSVVNDVLSAWRDLSGTSGEPDDEAKEMPSDRFYIANIHIQQSTGRLVRLAEEIKAHV